MPLLHVTNSHVSQLDVSHGFPNWVFPQKHSKPHAACSLPLSPPPSPVVDWRREAEAQKVKIIGWDKNNLLETAKTKEDEQ